jgi:hypothetical protein
MMKNCRMITGGEEYLVILHVIKMHSKNNTVPILLDRPWLRMSDVIVDLGGAKPSIIYGLKDNRVTVSIRSLGEWMKKKLYLLEEEEGNDKDKYENGEALVGVVHPGDQRPMIDADSESLGPSFYHWGVMGNMHND